jgi:uncharacterized protein (TIGR02001 family)
MTANDIASACPPGGIVRPRLAAAGGRQPGTNRVPAGSRRLGLVRRCGASRCREPGSMPKDGSGTLARKLRNVCQFSFDQPVSETPAMKPSLLARIALASAAVFVSSAFADGLSANVALATKYKYRGQDQSDPTKDAVPAIQGGFDYALGSFYLGNWNSSVSFINPVSGTPIGTEMDFYGGYKGKVSVLEYDVGLLQYYYPGSGGSLFNTTELYGQLGWQFITAKYSLTVSDRYFGWADAKNTGYLDVAANYEIAKGLTLNGHLGQTFFSSGAKSVGAANYSDYKLGATYDLGNNVSLAGAFVGANKKNVYGDVNKGRLIVTLSKAM